jgi:hypothetical protein
VALLSGVDHRAIQSAKEGPLVGPLDRTEIQGRYRLAATRSRLTPPTGGRTIGHTVHALAETATTYTSDPALAAHTKLSISLPSDLAEQVRLAAAESGVSVSGVIAAALRRSIAGVDQERLDRALELDAEANAAWASDALALTARAWADLTW